MYTCAYGVSFVSVSEVEALTANNVTDPPAFSIFERALAETASMPSKETDFLNSHLPKIFTNELGFLRYPSSVRLSLVSVIPLVILSSASSAPVLTGSYHFKSL
jgi:hypothetical protein